MTSTATHGARPIRVAIAGAGMSGLLMGIRLKQAGIEDFTIFEKAAEIGGTWRENRYPGLSCDVPAHYYTYTFEPNPEWRGRFAGGPAIKRYLCTVAQKYGLLGHIRFNQKITRAYHDGSRWQLSLADGGSDEADVVVAATGVLHHPKYPDIEGLDDFQGACFHSAQWPQKQDLAGKRIGLIGTGSTGVQIATALGLQGRDLTVFQRTPQWVLPMPDRRYTRAERWLTRAVPGVGRLLYRVYEYAFEHVFAGAVINRNSLQYKLIDRVVRWNLNRVKDPALKRRLTPPDAPMCRRMVISWDYYKAMQRDNVRLVTDRIDKVAAQGVVTADGKLHALDVLVLATGFHAHAYVRPMELETHDGHSLERAWAQRPQAHRTVGVPGLPNFFMIFGPKSPIGNYSLISIGETQTSYIMACIERLRRGEFATMAPRADVAAKLDAELEADMGDSAWVTGCASWYLDEKGVPDTWPSTPANYRDYMRQPKLEEFELT